MIRGLGKKQLEQASLWFTTAAGFGTSAFLGTLYFTDWRLFLDYLPYYNGKFPPREEEEKK